MEDKHSSELRESQEALNPDSPGHRKQVKSGSKLRKLTEKEIEAHKKIFKSLKKNPYQTCIEAEVVAPVVSESEEITKNHVIVLYATIKDFINEYTKYKAKIQQNIDDFALQTETTSNLLMEAVNEHSEHVGSLLEKQSQQDGINDDIYQKIDAFFKNKPQDYSKDIKDIKQQLSKTQTEVSTFIQNHNKQVQKLEKDHEENSSKIAEILVNMNKLQSTIRDVKTKVTNADTEYAPIAALEELQAQIEKTAQDQDTMRDNISIIESDVKDKMKELKTSYEKIVKEFKSKNKESPSDSSETSLKAMNCRLMTVQKEINKLKENQNNMDQKTLPLKVIQDSIEEIEGKLQKIVKTNTKMTENIDKHSDQIYQIREEEVKVMQDQLINIYNDYQTLDKRMQDCYNFIGEVALEQTHTKKINQDYKEVITKMEEIQLGEKVDIAEAKRSLSKTDTLMKQYKKRQEEEHKKLNELMKQVSTNKVAKDLDNIKEKQATLEKTLNSLERSFESSPKLDRAFRILKKYQGTSGEDDKQFMSDEELHKRKKVTNPNKPKNTKDQSPQILPFRIPYQGKILEISGSQLLEFKGNLKEAAKKVNLRAPKPEETHFKRIQFKWKGCLLITNEEELKEVKGNLNNLQELIEKKGESTKRIIRFNSGHKRTYDKITPSRERNNSGIKYTKEYIPKPTLKLIKMNKNDPSDESSRAENDQQENQTFRTAKRSEKH